jgi:Flp pilus assembly protein TadG
VSRTATPAASAGTGGTGGTRRTVRGEQGTGLISTAFGAVVFVLFLLLAVQVLLGLYTTTVVSATTIDAANRLARRSDFASPAAQQEQSDRATAALGAFGRSGRVAFDWTATTDDEVIVTVHARKMTLLPPAFGSALGNRIDRTIRVRVERLR